MPENDILVKITYKEENAKVVNEATARVETLGDKTATATQKMTDGFSKVQAGIVTFQAALMIADRIIGTVSKALDDTVGQYERYGRQVFLLSQNLGLSTEETSRLIKVSDDYGISVDTVTSALQMMTKRGVAPSIEALAQIADQYVALNDPVERAALMTELLGRNWTALTPLLRDGGDAIREQAAAISQDLILTKADIEATEALRKSKKELEDREEALGLKIGKLLAPAVTKAVGSFESWVEVLTPASTTEEQLRQAVIVTANAFGEQSKAVDIASKALQDYLILEKQVGMTASEKQLRSNMGNVKTLSGPSRTDYSILPVTEHAGGRGFISDIENQKKLDEQDYKNFEAEYKRKQSLAKLEQEISTKRIDAAKSLSKDLAAMDTGYYADRLKAAESYGLEAKRAEEDHQRDMRKLSQSHDQRMSKLADSRDALGLQDEIQSYESERKAAEEDYRITQSRRDEDYANQIRDMERAHQEQRQKRIDDYNQQLADIAAYNIAQKELIRQQMTNIADVILAAFTAAAAQKAVSNSTTNNNSAVVNQVINGGQGTYTPDLIKQVTYGAIVDVFGRK